MKIILINGPAGSGKDSTAEAVKAKNGHTFIKKFAAPIKRAVTAIYCAGDRETFDGYDVYERKGIACDMFLGKSCRQVQIDISEEYMKPMHGEKVFGQILASDLKQLDQNHIVQTVLVTDSGFRPEAEVLVEQFGAENIILVRIHRAGKTYEGDSRSYIQLEDLGVLCYDLENVDGEHEVTVKALEEIIRGNK